MKSTKRIEINTAKVFNKNTKSLLKSVKKEEENVKYMVKNR